MDFIKDTFLKLTQFTIPYGHEEKVVNYLPNGCKKDNIGNYFITIGKSDTLFTTHLDTYSKKYEKVNHVIEGDIIKTDGSTILGGDNKLGMTILLYMIKNGIPGTYYFFIGEEPIVSGGLFGSGNAAESNKDFFKKFKRAIAFDRKEKGSIVTRQMARPCCSNDFVTALSKEFKEAGMDYKSDPNAYYTDTASFLDIIPECTNLSAGGYKEHYKSEWVDLSYTRQLAEAALKINWESLPVQREVKEFENKRVVGGYQKFFSKKKIKEIKSILTDYNHLHTNIKEYETGNSEDLVFNTWFEDTNIRIRLHDDSIIFKIGDHDDMVLDNLVILDVYLSYIFGANIDLTQNGFKFDDDDNMIIRKKKSTLFKGDAEAYLSYFESINVGNTSYVYPGGREFVNTRGTRMPKKVVIDWFKYNFIDS